MAAWVRKPFEVGEILAVLREFARAPEGENLAQLRQVLDIARAPLKVRRLLHREGGGIGRRTSLRC